MSRHALAALVAALLLASCGGDDGGPSTEPEVTAATTSTTTTLPPGAIRVRSLLLGPGDVRPQGFRPAVEARPFDAATATRFLFCGEDLRAEAGVVTGRQSRFEAGAVELTHTVTSGGDPAALVERFRRLVGECPGPWTEPPLPTGGGPVRREITGAYPVPDVGVEAAGAVIRSRNGAGSTDTVVVVLAAGPVLSTLSVSGPLGADFGVVEPATRAAAARLVGGQSPGGP